MAENIQETKKSNPPTSKMLEAAKKAAERHNVQLPKGLAESYDICKPFLDEYLNKPTAKQLSFAERIAKEKGVALPDELRASSKDLSAWIDSNKG